MPSCCRLAWVYRGCPCKLSRCFLLDLWILHQNNRKHEWFCSRRAHCSEFLFISVSVVREHSTSLSSFPLFQGLVKANQDKAFGSPESTGLAQPLWFWCCPQLSVGAPEPQLFFLWFQDVGRVPHLSKYLNLVLGSVLHMSSVSFHSPAARRCPGGKS